jgi:FtsH-binding integral membrane protein
MRNRRVQRDNAGALAVAFVQQRIAEDALMTKSGRYSAQSIHRLDKVYACFLICGVAVLCFAMISLVNRDTSAAGRAGLLLQVPLMITVVAALFIAARFSIHVWRRVEVRILWFATLLFPASFLIGSGELRGVAGCAYALVAIALPVRWFAALRKVARVEHRHGHGSLGRN